MNLRAAAGIALLPLLFVLAWFILHPRPANTVPPKPVVLFSETGNLVRNNPGLEPDMWYLVYEKPGAPSLHEKLRFDAESRCGSENALTRCTVSFDQGQRVSVVGEMETGGVLVKKLIYSAQ